MDVQSYLRSIANSPRFTRAEEAQLCRAARRGCARSREKLILSVLPYALSLAKRYASKTAPLDEMIACANVGVLVAVDTLNPAKGRLTTNATWKVHSECMRWKREHTRPLVKLPSTTTDVTRPLIDAFCEREIVQFRDEFHAPAIPPLDEPEALDLADRRARLHDAIGLLQPREQDVMRRRLAGDILEDIGRDLGITRERIRQIEHKARTKLRGILGTKRRRGWGLEAGDSRLEGGQAKPKARAKLLRPATRL